MQYSKKLKDAMGEIKKILKENDIAGFVILHTPGYAEYCNYLETSYSAMSTTDDSIRITLKRDEVGEEEFQKRAEGTYNMITHFSDLTAMHSSFYKGLHQTLKEKWNGSEESPIHTSHKA